MKICTGCKQNLTFDNFGKATKNKDGLNFKCKTCRRVIAKESHLKHKARMDPIVKARRNTPEGKEKRRQEGVRARAKLLADPEKKAAKRVYNKEYRNRPGKIEIHQKREKARNLRIKYGITIEDYNKMLDSQNGCCLICSVNIEIYNKLEKKFRVFCVDHCHETGKIRGLLCTECNKALGLFKDSSEIALRAHEYLKSHKS